MNILYFHGFASAGSSGTVNLLRNEFAPTGGEVKVVAPDIPVDPAEALPMLKKLAAAVNPVLIIGTSMGGMYAQMMHGYRRICVNPSFSLSKKTDIVYPGVHKWFNRRADGETEFTVTEETVRHFREMEAGQFAGITAADRTLCHALFGDEDTIGLPHRAVFESHYPGMSTLFHGGHRMNERVVRHVLIPYIREKGLIEARKDQGRSSRAQGNCGSRRVDLV